MATNPMHQFNVYRIGPEIKFGSLDISFTNASLFMALSSLAIIILFSLGIKKKTIIPDKIQLLTELSYTFVSKMISDTAGSKAKPYFGLIFSLFMFVLFCNMLGMIPYSFTVTSHIIVTFVLATFVFIGVTIIGFLKHGLGYLKLFVPSGVPALLLPLIVVIEIISYLSRPVSLSVRLFANMMAGHTMLKVFGGFVISLGLIGGWLPLSFSVALTGLEILVAFLQAYVFAILTCIYLNDALNLHH
jgi:F-type H+-transporting ATPase subunit a|tara:strand:- start:3541 stop:4275 length:735 start_codon:yes stop_codon:yes gene_type:complete